MKVKSSESNSVVSLNYEPSVLERPGISTDVTQRIYKLCSSLMTSVSSSLHAVGASIREALKATSTAPSLDLTTSDRLRAGTNLVRWGLIGAGFYGVSPTLLIPMNVLAGLTSETLLFCSLPKDASWLRKALSIPVLSNAIIQYNPWTARFFQAVSLYNLIQYSKERLGNVWRDFRIAPKKAIQAGVVHGFNLASGLLFAARDLKALLPTKESFSTSDDFPIEPPSSTQEHTDTSSAPDLIHAPTRSIKWATIYDNKGNLHRDQISKLVTQNHQRYANQWGLETEVVDHSLVKDQCQLDGRPIDCSPYFNKLAYLMQQCKNDQSNQDHEQWVIYADDDLLVTNPNINPWLAIDELREGKNTSVIMAREGADWIKLFPLPGYKKYDPRIGVNSGFIIARMDDKACTFIEKAWNHRNTPTDPNSWNYPNCKTVGSCSNQKTVLNDQTAVAMALQDDLSVIDRDVTVAMPRDARSKMRRHIAFNTLHRDGCQSRGDETSSYDIGSFDRTNYPDGQWRPGDWVGQTAGFPVTGRYPLRKNLDGNCRYDPSIPKENIRLKKLLEMVHHTPKEQHFTLGMTYTPDASKEADYARLTTKNHQEYARINHAQFRSMTDPIRMDCDFYGETKQCEPYWRKIFEIDRFLRQPDRKNKEEWYVYADEDGVYGDMTLSLSKVLKDLKEKKDPSIIVTKDLRDDISPTNTGLIFVRKDDASRKFVQKWLEMRNAPTGKRECPTLGTCSQKYSLHEQEALNQLLRNPAWKNTVKVVKIRSDSRSYGVNSLFRDGCFLEKKQVNGKFVHERRKDFTGDPFYNSAGMSRQGDMYMQAAGVPRMGEFCDRQGELFPIRKQFIEKMLEWVKHARFVPQVAPQS